ncbi:MAG: hypothetical protein QG657_4971 [Acidobacteriota bacterium]|nr:hypothetical protein [Acidobacteriota bacterium]
MTGLAVLMHPGPILKIMGTDTNHLLDLKRVTSFFEGLPGKCRLGKQKNTKLGVDCPVTFY